MSKSLLDTPSWIYGPALLGVLDDFTVRHPQHREAAADLLLHLEDADLSARERMLPTTSWAWPAPGWDRWVEDLTPALENLPQQMAREMIFSFRGHKQSWLQIFAGGPESYALAFGDQTGRLAKPARLDKLGWAPVEEFPGVWNHEWEMLHPEGALDRAAQLIHLGLRMRPSQVKLKKVGPA